MRRLIIVLSLALAAAGARADSEIMPRPLVFVSPNGFHYFRMIPGRDFKEENAAGFLHQVGQDGDALLYRTEGWYSFNVLVSNDGRYLASRGPWPRSSVDPSKMPAVSFYAEGEHVRTYYVSDLIQDLSNLQFTVSHYNWGGNIEWSDEPWSGVFTVETVEGRTLEFDIARAALVE